MNYQNITATKLGQVEVGTSYSTVYMTPILTRTFVKDVEICNTTSSLVTFSMSLVPAAGVAGASNAIMYNASIPANTSVQWSGTQIMLPGETLQVKASAVGVTVTASGAEAV